MQRALRAARAPRSESDKFVAESLTMPAASLRSGGQPSSAPTTAPSAVQQNSTMAVTSSDDTLQLGAVPSSDQTIEEKVPRTPQMLAGELPSIGPATPPPHTERITGTRVPGPTLQQVQAAMNESAAYDRTIASPGAIRASVPVAPTLTSSSGSGPYAVISSGVPTPGLAPRGSGSLLPPRASANPPVPSAAPSPGSVPPASLGQRSSARAVVIISILLILACAAAGAWVLLHR
jgi:hypothetical protein